MNPKKDKLNSTTNNTLLNPLNTLKNEAAPAGKATKKKVVKKKQKSSDAVDGGALKGSELRKRAVECLLDLTFGVNALDTSVILKSEFAYSGP